MPSIASTLHLSGAIGTQPLSVVDAQAGTIWLDANGGGSGFVAPNRMAAVVDGLHLWTWERHAVGDWRRAEPLSPTPRAATRLHCAETGDWLASDQAASGFTVWGRIGGNEVQWSGLLCDDMASDGTFVLSGPAIAYRRRIHWPWGQIDILPDGTEVRLSPGHICYRLAGEKRIRIATPGLVSVAVQCIDTEQRPGPVFTGPDGRRWVSYNTEHLGHACNPVDDARRGYYWPTGDQINRAARMVGERVYFAWGKTGADLPPYGVESHVLGQEMVDLPTEPEPPHMPDVQAIRRTLESIRATYPNPLEHDGQAGEILNKACKIHEAEKWGLLHKPGGGGVPSPQGKLVPYDIICQPNMQHWDVATGEWPKMTIIDPIGPHEGQPGWQWVAPVEPSDTPGPVDPPPPTFDKEKVKEETIASAASLVKSMIGVDDPQGCREQWDRFGPDWLPSVPEVADGAILRFHGVPVETIDAFLPAALAETKRLRVKAGYACGPASAPVPSIERVRVNGLKWETVSGKPWQWRGCTAFDLPYRIGKLGDFAFADWLAEQRFTIARIVPATVYRQPRTLKEGIAWLRPTLRALQQRGLWAEVTTLVDTGPGGNQYDMSADDMRAYVAEIGAICAEFTNTIMELANENGHVQNQNSLLLTNEDFCAELRALVPAHVMVSHGSHGGDQMQIDDGNYVTIHEARDKTPEANAAIWSPYQFDAIRRPLVRDEPIGVAEVAVPNKRTNDPAYGGRLGASTRQRGLGGATLHLEAGLTADVALLGPADSVQRRCAAGFISAMVSA